MSILSNPKALWYDGLQARMICLLFLVTSFIFGFFMMLSYVTTREKSDTELSDLSLFFANHLSISLMPALWNFDHNAADLILEATMKEKQVMAIYVIDLQGNVMNGKTRNDRWESMSTSQTSSFDDIVVNRKNIVRKNPRSGDVEVLGDVEVMLTRKFARKKLRDDIVRQFVTFSVLDILLLLMLFFSIKKVIILPIKAVADYLRRLSVGDIPEQITEFYRGEFNEIRKSLNMLIEATNQTTKVAEEIAVGNMAVQVVERSGHDRMMTALVRMIQRLKEISNETNKMIQAVEIGRLDIRGDAASFEGGWNTLVRGVNQLLDGLSTAVSEKATLNHEMALAKKIQTSLLPALSQDFHPEFEITATMLPADQVGGDFFDITYDRAGNLWLAIGDVSGHGVTPGLIMMMAQTVYSTVTTNIECDAREVVVMLNHILYKNVHERLSESHFMTFTALKHLGGGRFQYAGAHLSMIVFRQETGCCELIRTQGVYLNFKEDIAKAITNFEFDLHQGDFLVLYTDGLTEARNRKGEMLDTGGFVKIIEQHSSLEPEVMKDTIMADVIRWCDDKRADDMSVVIMKRKVLH